MNINNTIIVPIQAQACVVFNDRNNKPKKINLATRFEDGNTVLGKDQQFDWDELFNTDSDESFERGIHLHWKLPKALKHGIASDKGEIEFPLVPNRWMIVRYQTDVQNLKKIPSKTWLLQSDVINEDESNNWVVLEETHHSNSDSKDGTTSLKKSYDFKSIGKATEWNNDFTENDADSVSLTAVGAFNPYFSEVYDDCKNIFAFHDDMNNVIKEGAYSYVITGWYSKPENDPFHPKTLLNSTIVAKIKESWKLNTTTTPPNKIEKSIFQTSILGVGWNENTKDFGIHKDVTLALGNTTTEALSALVTHLKNDQKPTLKNAEVYLTALQNDLLEEENKIPSLDQLRIENHKRQFTPVQRGFIWKIKKRDKNTSIDSENTLSHFPEVPQLVTTLRALNEQQMQCNIKVAQRQSWQQEYYFCWYKKMLANTEDKGHLIENIKNDLENYKNQIESVSNEIDTIKSNITNYVAQIGANALIQLPEMPKPSADYELVKEVEDRFWETNDPALLFYGDGLQEVQKYHQGLQDNLPCRLVSEVINNPRINETTFEVSNFNLQNFNLKNDSIPFEIIQALVYEALLLDQGMAKLIARKIYGGDNELDSKVVQDFSEEHVLPFQNKVIEKMGNLGIHNYSPTWVPMFMAWEATYKLDKKGGSINCKGFIPVTNGVSKNLHKFLSEATPNTYQNCVAQSMSGFYKQLVAQVPYLQLPPLNYTIDDDGDFRPTLQIDDATLSMMGANTEAYKFACNPAQKSFSPIVQGMLSFKNIALVDAFGRKQTVYYEILAKKIVITGQVTASSIPLNKRLVQPARLQWDWINQQKQIIHQDTGKLDHPILGWLVPNYLDNRLMVYDALGNELRNYTTAEKNETNLFPSGTDDLRADVPLTETPAENKDLLTIVDQLDIINFLKKSKDLYQKSTNYKSPNMVSLLYGQPIAVATAQVSMALLGDAYRNPSWEKTDSIDYGDIAKHSISITVGDSKQTDDGFLGYYLQEEYSNLKSTEHKIEIRPNDTPVKITVLVQANSAIYIDSDQYLPTKVVRLPEHTVEDLMQNINISFMLCPFMATAENPTIPVPKGANSNAWYWIHRSDVTTWQNPKEIKTENKEEIFDFQPQHLYEGWIKIQEFKKTNPKTT